MPRGVLFDIDGVIVDSADIHYRAWAQTALARGGPEFSRAFFDATFGTHNEQIIPCWLGRRVSTDEVETIAGEKEALFRQIAERDLEALPGACTLIHALRAAEFRLATASSAPRDNVTLMMEVLGLAGAFDAFISGNDVTQGKPHPEVFLKAAAAINVAPQRCVVIEDAPQGVSGGRRAGCRVIAVTSSRPRAELSEADLVVDSLEELSAPQIAALLG